MTVATQPDAVSDRGRLNHVAVSRVLGFDVDDRAVFCFRFLFHDGFAGVERVRGREVGIRVGVGGRGDGGCRLLFRRRG